MIYELEDYLRRLQPREKIMIVVTVFALCGFLFYQNVFLSYQNDNNFLRLQRLTAEQKNNEVRGITKSKSLAQIQEENKQRKNTIAQLESETVNAEKRLKQAHQNSLADLQDKYLVSRLDDNTTTIKMNDNLLESFMGIDYVNQHFKIDYFKLSSSSAGFETVLVFKNRIINPTRLEVLKDLENPFFNPSNIIEITSIIGKNAKINGAWYSEDDNITDAMVLSRVNAESIIITDSKGKRKTFSLYE